jgi:hypothetical protein
MENDQWLCAGRQSFLPMTKGKRSRTMDVRTQLPVGPYAQIVSVLADAACRDRLGQNDNRDNLRSLSMLDMM